MDATGASGGRKGASSPDTEPPRGAALPGVAAAAASASGDDAADSAGAGAGAGAGSEAAAGHRPRRRSSVGGVAAHHFMTCSLCRRAVLRLGFSPFFRHRALEAEARRCMSCAELTLQAEYKRAKAVFGDTHDVCTVFEAARCV